MNVSRIRFVVLGFWVLVIGWLLFSPGADYSTIPAPAGTGPDGSPLYWFKGNTHSHAKLTVADFTHGDSSVAGVAAWYRDHGYHFAAVTDHNRYSDGTALPPSANEEPGFVLIPGTEITSDHRYPGVIQEGERKIHATALNAKQSVEWSFDDPDKSSILQLQSTQTARAGGVYILNHPNYRFQVELADILGAGNVTLFEVFNAHPRSNQSGHAAFRPAVEDLWDQVLSNGHLLYGVAADDAHDFKWYRQLLRRFGTAPPGGAWVMVKSPKLAADDLVEAMAAGEFYASTGVHLKQVSVSADYYEIELDPERTRQETAHRWVRDAAPVIWSDDSHYVIEFIGLHGRVLHATHDQLRAGIRLDAGQSYVRAKVTWLEKLPSMTGADNARAYFAWTQPVMTNTQASTE